MNNYKQISQNLINSYQSGDISIIAVVAGLTHFGNIAYEEFKQEKLDLIKGFIEQYTEIICKELGVYQVWFDKQVTIALQKKCIDIELVIEDVCFALFNEKHDVQKLTPELSRSGAGQEPTPELVSWYKDLKERLKMLVKSTTHYQVLNELTEKYSRNEREIVEKVIQLEDDPQFRPAFEQMEPWNKKVSEIASAIIKENPSLLVESAFQQALVVVLQTDNIYDPSVREILTRLSGVSIQMKKI